MKYEKPSGPYEQLRIPGADKFLPPLRPQKKKPVEVPNDKKRTDSSRPSRP